MSKTPTTDALDAELKGEWHRCYALMHVNAVKLETALTDAVATSNHYREKFLTEKAVADTVRDQLKAKQVDKPPAADPTGCCDQWKEKSWRLNVVSAFHDGLRSTPDYSIKFCPWCGKAC